MGPSKLWPVRPPPETIRLFREAELRAEGLVGLLRMLSVLILVLSFTLVVADMEPRAHSDVLEKQWFYASAMMAGYFILGALAWWGYRRGWLRIWMIWPAAAADCLFFLCGVWISMVNTGLPGSHAFVFTAVWLGPVVLAFGVLRFNPGIQAFIAVLTVGGLAYLISLPAGDGFVPRSGVAGLFLASAPNAMRVAMLGLAGAVLVVAAVRTRLLLLRSITEAQNTANLTRYLPGQLAPRLAAGGLDELRRGRWKEAGILFIDLRGFTRLSQGMTAQELSEFATEYRRRVTAVARATGGILDKFMGDAAMIVFEEGAESAITAGACVDCALRLREEIADWSRARVAVGAVPLRAGIGLHWGPVFSGVVGTTDRLEYSVFGDTVNIAARLEEETKRLDADILASCDILQMARQDEEALPWDMIAETELRGRDGVLRLRGVRRAQQRAICAGSKTGAEGPVSDDRTNANRRMRTMEISARKLAQVAVMARELGRAEGELRAFIDRMSEDEQAELVAVMWIGRESFFAEDWDEALATAKAEATTPCADYLIGTPHLSDNLENGMDALGISVEDVENDLM